MKAILAYLEEHARPGAFVGLMAAKDVSSFYTQFGFAVRPSERPGMFRLQEELQLVNALKDPSKMESLTSLPDRNAPLSHSLRREQREGGRARDKREELGSHLLLWGQLDTIAQGF